MPMLFWLLFSALSAAPGGISFAQASRAWVDSHPLSPHTIAIAGQDPSPDPASTEPAKSRKQSKQQKEKAQTLTGTVEWEYQTLYWTCDVPNCDHFALYDDATHMNYEIDDARAALPFEGKKATITGIVNQKNHTIHLLTIQSTK